MDVASIILAVALFGVAASTGVVIESGRRNRRATRKAEEIRRRQMLEAKRLARDPAELRVSQESEKQAEVAPAGAPAKELKAAARRRKPAVKSQPAPKAKGASRKDSKSPDNPAEPAPKPPAEPRKPAEPTPKRLAKRREPAESAPKPPATRSKPAEPTAKSSAKPRKRKTTT